MATAIIIPRDYVYPVATVTSVFWLTTWQMIKVGRARKAANIPYPQVYADKAEAAASPQAQVFNCAQRAHQNTLENLPTVLFSTLILGLKHPVYAASLCGVWTVFRVFYTIGYSTGDPKKRNLFGSAAVNAFSTLGLLLGATYTAVKLVTDSL
ncbi:membrane-associated proteins in eicosanoid and glutathione metabolism [Obba rivulosa]|uniref:Glutathione S-transferase 3, mitochondrial n=1 Tax=Obba rivulosa TaxID=1052685 RepID=A0A8E2DUV8_9APHY|nr:membrane-associated proteins in eicosanoid and glutathione metabolism [Obba rivulosa]